MSRFEEIVTLVKTNAPIFRKLEIYHYFHVNETEAGFLIESLHSNTTITSFTFIDQKLGINVTRQIADLLKHNKTITHLDISENRLSNEEVEVIGSALRHNTTLTSLVISRNFIGDNGAIILAEHLKHNHTLKILAICNNEIGNEGADAIISLLESNDENLIMLFNEENKMDEIKTNIIYRLTNKIRDAFLHRPILICNIEPGMYSTNPNELSNILFNLSNEFLGSYWFEKRFLGSTEILDEFLGSSDDYFLSTVGKQLYLSSTLCGSHMANADAATRALKLVYTTVGIPYKALIKEDYYPWKLHYYP